MERNSHCGNVLQLLIAKIKMLLLVKLALQRVFTVSLLSYLDPLTDSRLETEQNQSETSRTRI